MTKNYDSDSAIAISREIFWIGFTESRTRLHCNPYLMIDGDDVILFDPGSIPDFPKVMRKVIDLVNPERITHIVASHQDPDVCGNLAVVEDVIRNPDLKICAHLNTVRLIQHLGLHSEFYVVEENDYSLTLRSGRRLEFIYMPYLHAPGAIATLDTRSGTLFSGDVFGALSESDNLFDTSGFPQSMDSFHQAYMPSNTVLRKGMERLERYDIQTILPQHGSVIEGENVRIAMDHLKALRCGSDLL